MSDVGTCFVIMGYTVAYDGSSAWPCRVFADEQAAKAYLLRLQQWAKDAGIWAPTVGPKGVPFETLDNVKNPLDPMMNVDTTGVDWKILEVPFGV